MKLKPKENQSLSAKWLNKLNLIKTIIPQCQVNKVGTERQLRENIFEYVQVCDTKTRKTLGV